MTHSFARLFWYVLRGFLKVFSFHSYKKTKFRNIGKGVLGEPLPDGYVYYRQSYEYLKGEARNPEINTILNIAGRFAVRTEIQPDVFIESHNSDEEPVVGSFSHDRLILWETLVRTDCPVGWKRGKKNHNLRKIGISHLDDEKEYWKKWDPHAQRHRKKWLAQSELSIQEISLEDFIYAFYKSNKLPEWRDMFVELLERRRERNGSALKLFGAVNKGGNVVAGLAVLDLHDVSTSRHMIAFFDDSVGKTSVNVGLIDYWHQHCLKKKLRFLDFGIFWHPGDKKEFQGFSQFKSQFNIHYIVLLPELERWCKAGEGFGNLKSVI